MSAWCVIVPCFNEAGRLDGDAFSRFLDFDPDAHFLFVDDGSTDGTRRMLESLAGRYRERLRVFGLEKNSGKAEAVRKGANSLGAWKTFEYVGYIDADLSTPLEGIQHLRGALEREPRYEFALGSRIALLGRNIQRNAMRHYLGRVFATATSLILDLTVYDTQCGAKLFRATLVPEIFDRPFVTRWFFDVEILFRILTSRGREAGVNVLVEVPLFLWTEKSGSKLKPSDVLRTPLLLFQIWRHYRRDASSPGNRRRR